MNWFFETFNWYLYLLVLGILFFPLVKKIFSSFLDSGYPFAKTLGILLTSYALFVLGVFKLVPFDRSNVILILFFWTVGSFFIFKNKSAGSPEGQNRSKQIFLIVIEEILFISALFFLAYVRGQEPSVRGLEKFMDFGFINSILKSKFFPPLDMWLSADPTHVSGYAINYYYFGHLTGAFLIKLTGINPSIGYNLILATIFAQGITLTFSLTLNIIYSAFKKIGVLSLILFSALGSYLVNFAGNLHTIYLFTLGYPNDNPVPFWTILSWFNPTKYWYPNATRFIPYTIHEFPSYSYVVADLHGHVFDIPFVLLTLAMLFKLITSIQTKTTQNYKLNLKNSFGLISTDFNYFQLFPTIFLGFMTAVHYMTNAFDGPIYLLLTLLVLFIIAGFSRSFLIHAVFLFSSFYLFSKPFSKNFIPFVSGIGVNCSPKFLVDMKKIGPFLFESEKCQISPLWMLFVLWGFFWISFIIFLIIKNREQRLALREKKPNPLSATDIFMLLLFALSTFLVIVPEFFYIKDIYPAHFRANTMFKLGYQAFMMMGIASAYVFVTIRFMKKSVTKYVLKTIYILLLFLVSLYPFFSFPSYYGGLNKVPQLDGAEWMKNSFPQDKELVDYINTKLVNQPVILEAQGDSYTDYERISAYTGSPTVAGWWVHEWLWRGSSDVVGVRIPDITNIYESEDLSQTHSLIDKYKVNYIIVSGMEKEKYKNLKEDKFGKIGTKIFTTSNGIGALYQISR